MPIPPNASYPTDFSSFSARVSISGANPLLHYGIQLIPEASGADERDCDHGDHPERAGIILQEPLAPGWRPVFDGETPGPTAEERGLARNFRESPKEESRHDDHDRHGRDEQNDPPFEIAFEQLELLLEVVHDHFDVAYRLIEVVRRCLDRP